NDPTNLTRVDLRSDCNQDANYAEEMKFKWSKIEKVDITSSVIGARAKEFYEMFRKVEGNSLKKNLSCSIAFYPNQECCNEFHRRANGNKLIINLSTNLMNSLQLENELESKFGLALTSGSKHIPSRSIFLKTSKP